MANEIMASDDAWDSRELGADAAHIGICSESEEAEIDAMMELQPISIRLPKSLIENFKMIASYHGVGYQPLMRDILCRFAQSETQKIMHELMEARSQEQQAREQHLDDPTTDRPTERKCA